MTRWWLSNAANSVQKRGCLPNAVDSLPMRGFGGRGGEEEQEGPYHWGVCGDPGTGLIHTHHIYIYVYIYVYIYTSYIIDVYFRSWLFRHPSINAESFPGTNRS